MTFNYDSKKCRFVMPKIIIIIIQGRRIAYQFPADHLNPGFSIFRSSRLNVVNPLWYCNPTHRLNCLFVNQYPKIALECS